MCVCAYWLFQAIRDWLAHNSGWLFVVEDVSPDCEALAKWIPPGGDGKGNATGHVLVTSQSGPDDCDLFKKKGVVTKTKKLGVLKASDCVELWANMGIRGMGQNERVHTTALSPKHYTISTNLFGNLPHRVLEPSGGSHVRQSRYGLFRRAWHETTQTETTLRRARRGQHM